MTTQDVRIGIIGASGAFGLFIASAIAEIEGARITAIAGIDEERTRHAADMLGAESVYLDYHALLKDDAVDLVVVATPPHLHGVMGVDALDAGKALFMEKPIATTVGDTQALLAAAARSTAPATVDFVLRYNPLFVVLEDWTSQNLFGMLQRVDFQNFAGDEALPPTHWFWNPVQSGGILVEHGVHFFDIYGLLVGALPVAVQGTLTTRPGTSQEDKVLATVTYENGATGTYYHAFDKPSRLEKTTGKLAYDRGYIEIDGWIAMSLTLDAAVSERERAILAATPDIQLDLVERYEGAARQTRGAGNDYTVDWRVKATLALKGSKEAVYRSSVTAALRDLVAQLRDPGFTPRVTLQDGARSTAIAFAAIDPTLDVSALYSEFTMP